MVLEVDDGREELAEYPAFISFGRGEWREANKGSIFGFWLGFGTNSIWVLVHMHHRFDIAWSWR